MEYALEIEDLEYAYPDGYEALRGVSMRVRRGSRTCLLGPNGAGKSTLILHMNGLLTPRKGTVKVLGREVRGKDRRWVRKLVGLVFQDPDDQVFAPTVGEDVAFGPTNLGLPPEEVERRVLEALEAVGMSAYRHKPPHHLSYGQKKRVAIAGVLAMDPEVIVLDEPMAYLDPLGRRELTRVLSSISGMGRTVFVATHDVDMAAEWAEEIIIMSEGRVVVQGGADLVTDRRLMGDNRLVLPTVTEVFEGVPEFSAGPKPRTKAQAAMYIRKLISSSGNRDPGIN